MAPRTRPPSGAPSWPLVLLEGSEFAGKTFTAAQFTASDRVGDCYWLPIGEAAPDAVIPGADYLVVEHNGSWFDIVDQVAEVHAVAEQSESEKPTVLVIDSMTCKWELLKDWITVRARESRNAQKLLREDPNADIKVSSVLWDEAAARHADLMGYLTTFNGIVVLTARCREAVVTDTDGRMVVGSADYKVDAHRGLAHAASVWVRMSRDEAPTLIGCRTAGSKIRPGVDKPLRFPSFSLDELLFEELGYDLTDARPATVTPLIADESVLAPQARAAVRQYTQTHGLDENQVLQAFYRQHKEPLKDCRDTAVILHFLGQLKQQERAA